MFEVGRRLAIVGGVVLIGSLFFIDTETPKPRKLKPNNPAARSLPSPTTSGHEAPPARDAVDLEPAQPVAQDAQKIIDDAIAMLSEHADLSFVAVECAEIGPACTIDVDLDSNVSISELLENLQAECGSADDTGIEHRCDVYVDAIEAQPEGHKQATLVLRKPTR